MPQSRISCGSISQLSEPVSPPNASPRGTDQHLGVDSLRVIDAVDEGKKLMKILVVDDEPQVCGLVTAAFSQNGHQAVVASSGEEALELTAGQEFDLILCDVMMGGMSGFDVLRELRRVNTETEIVLMTGQASVESAMDAVMHGANDYICKPFSLGVLQAIVSNVEQRRQQSRMIKVEARPVIEYELVGNSPAMIDVVKAATRVAATELPVVIKGESGTGKELVARLIHKRSRRNDKPFVAVNCGALPDTLLEAELFGHTRGAFTGADQARRGLFEEAHGGTLLLDEVTETSAQFQVKLLRTLQEGEIRPLGTNTKKRVDVRIIAATNRDLGEQVDKGAFRQDLLFRLQGMAINLPPLRDRRDDIRPLLFAFLSQARNGNSPLLIAKDALAALERYDWPGNVRELVHLTRRLAAFSNGFITLADLPAGVLAAPQAKSLLSEIIPGASDGFLPLHDMEVAYVWHVLNAVGGNKSKAAQILQIDRKTLYRLIEQKSEEKAEAHPKPTADRDVECPT